jgi:hypothetical protein
MSKEIIESYDGSKEIDKANEEHNKNFEAFVAEEAPSIVEKKRELQQDFKSFVESLPKKHKRRLMPHRKFGNQLEQKLRMQRLANMKTEE